MPKVTQAHLDARRQQIVDAARARFASHGFARTSMSDLVTASGLSTGAIYRYFASKDEIVTAICEQTSGEVLPTELSFDSVLGMLDGIRTRARAHDHARLVAQIYAEAALAPPLAAIVDHQLAELRSTVTSLLGDRTDDDAARIAEGFVAVCVGYSQQLAVRGDLDPAPFTAALKAIVDQ